jgi:predicted amino acid dehydrogenase
MRLKDNLGPARRQTLHNLRAEENRQAKMTNTLQNFFGQNKLYLKSVAERGVIGPEHIKSQIEYQKK